MISRLLVFNKNEIKVIEIHEKPKEQYKKRKEETKIITPVSILGTLSFD